MTPRAEHRDARGLLLASGRGVLSTLSIEAEGFPFGSAVPYCLDRKGRPILLLSDIAQHTKNLEVDPRACLTVLAAGDDIQASARLAVLARASAAGEESEEAAERYYRYFPAARDYHRAHAFAFYRLELVRLRWIGGFGDIRWIEPGDFVVENPFDRQQEAAIVDHMNEDHASALRHYARKLAGLEVAEGEEVAMSGIDAEGCDLRVAGRRVRIPFAEPVTTAGQARERLVALARSG